MQVLKPLINGRFTSPPWRDKSVVGGTARVCQQVPWPTREGQSFRIALAEVAGVPLLPNPDHALGQKCPYCYLQNLYTTFLMDPRQFTSAGWHNPFFKWLFPHGYCSICIEPFIPWMFPLTVWLLSCLPSSHAFELPHTPTNQARQVLKLLTILAFIPPPLQPQWLVSDFVLSQRIIAACHWLLVSPPRHDLIDPAQLLQARAIA